MDGPITEIQGNPKAYAGLNARFRQADLSLKEWKNGLAAASYDRILAFAVLHHIPGRENRRRLIKQVAPLLAPQGQFVHANWQFLNSPRLQARIQPWEAAGLSEEDVETGDYLLDWRRGGRGPAGEDRA